MMLVEEGRLLITDPVAKYIPAFADVKVGVERGDGLELVARRAADHGPGPDAPHLGADLRLHRRVAGAAAVRGRRDQGARTDARPSTCEALAALPLQHQPGEVWEYSLSTDVLGRIVEIVEGGSLGEVLRERIFAPLGMGDTAFFTPPAKIGRRAEPFSFDFLTNAGVAGTISRPRRRDSRSAAAG